MTARSGLKVRVALGFSRLILLLLLSFSLHAQTTDDLLQRNVTIIGHNIDFEDVLEQLTLQTKMRFIYSSSMVSLDKPVTLMIRQQPLKNVLDELSAQMNITFKRQGDYLVVKKDNSAVAKTHFILAQPKLANSEDFDEEEPETQERTNYTNRSDVYTVSVYEERDPQITKDLMNSTNELKLKYRPLLLAENARARPRMQWFASGGFFLNDYGVGLELQSGIPLIHALVNVSALGSGMYRLGYGLGTAIPLKPLVTANIAYTFASLKREEADSWHNQYQATSHHHQIRFMANLSVSGHFSVRFGPTFNILSTTYQYLPEPGGNGTVLNYRSAPTQQYLSPSQGNTRSVQYQSVSEPADYKAVNSWVGFELGVAYRVNFSLRK